MPLAAVRIVKHTLPEVRRQLQQSRSIRSSCCKKREINKIIPVRINGGSRTRLLIMSYFNGDHHVVLIYRKQRASVIKHTLMAPYIYISNVVVFNFCIFYYHTMHQGERFVSLGKNSQQCQYQAHDHNCLENVKTKLMYLLIL